MHKILPALTLKRQDMLLFIVIFSFFDLASTYFFLKMHVLREGHVITKSMVSSLGLESGLIAFFLLITILPCTIIYKLWDCGFKNCKVFQWVGYALLCCRMVFILRNAYCLSAIALFK